MAIKFFSFMARSPRKKVPDMGIELRAACLPNGHASDRAGYRAQQSGYGFSKLDQKEHLVPKLFGFSGIFVLLLPSPLNRAGSQ